MGRATKALVAVALIALAASSSALAQTVPECTGPVSVKRIFKGPESFKGVVVGGQGRMYVSGRQDEYDSYARLWRIDRPGAEPVLIASGPDAPGGLAWRGKKLIWGVGSYDPYKSHGGPEYPRQASVLEVDPSTGKSTILASRVGSTNGVTPGPDGSVFVTNSFLNSSNINRIGPHGGVQRAWAQVKYPFGMVIGKWGQYMYVTQKYATPPVISTVEIEAPDNVTSWFQPSDEERKFSYFGGITRDDENNLFVGATGGVWKVRPGKKACVIEIADTLNGVAFGAGKKRFTSAGLYAVGEGGGLYRISGARRAVATSARA